MTVLPVCIVPSARVFTTMFTPVQGRELRMPARLTYSTLTTGCLTVLTTVIELVSPGRCALNHSMLSSSIYFSNAVRCSSVAWLV